MHAGRQLSVHATEQGLKKHCLKTSETQQCIWICPWNLDVFYLNIFRLSFKDQICGDAPTEMYSNARAVIFSSLILLPSQLTSPYSDFSTKCILIWCLICKVSACSYFLMDKLQHQLWQCREGKRIHGKCADAASSTGVPTAWLY